MYAHEGREGRLAKYLVHQYMMYACNYNQYNTVVVGVVCRVTMQTTEQSHIPDKGIFEGHRISKDSVCGY